MGSAPNADPAKRKTKIIIPTTRLLFILFFPPSLIYSHPAVFLALDKTMETNITNHKENQTII
jgi:hypothetical protein